MTIAARVDRLERLATQRAPCRACGGRLVDFRYDDGDGYPPTAPCPVCGRVPRLVVFGYDAAAPRT